MTDTLLKVMDLPPTSDLPSWQALDSAARTSATTTEPDGPMIRCNGSSVILAVLHRLHGKPLPYMPRTSGDTPMMRSHPLTSDLASNVFAEIATRLTRLGNQLVICTMWHDYAMTFVLACELMSLGMIADSLADRLMEASQCMESDSAE